MKALLLAAGYGSRLRPITDSIPKCLVKINGICLLDYWLKILKNDTINEILINTHYLAEQVEDFINNNQYKDKVSLVKEESLLGTGGTLLKNQVFFNNEPLLLVHADNLSLFNLDDFINSHKNRPKGTLITMMIFKTDMPQNSGIVELNEFGIVKNFYEKVANPPSDLANAALYIIEPEVFFFLSSLKKEIIDISTEVLPNFLNRINTFYNNIYHRDIGTIESYENAQTEFPIIQKKYNFY
jgi:mannose-1-phosphate guanylyltransferase